MKHHQRGLSLWGFMFVGALAALALLLGFKVFPSVVEYLSIKKAITAIAADSQNATVADIRRSFQKRADVDDFTSVTAQDLDITKESGAVVISVAYSKKISLFANVSLLIDYEASTAGAKSRALAMP